MNEARQQQAEAVAAINGRLAQEASEYAAKQRARDEAVAQVEELVQKNAKLHEELDASKAECAELKKTLEQAQGGHQMLVTTIRTLSKMVP